MRLALDGLFAFSYRPLQLASAFGATVSVAAFLIALAVVFLKLVHGFPVHGWTSLIVAVLFLGGVQLICLGILGEYVARIDDEVRARPFVVAAVVGDTRLPLSAGAPADRRERPSSLSGGARRNRRLFDVYFCSPYTKEALGTGRWPRGYAAREAAAAR